MAGFWRLMKKWKKPYNGNKCVLRLCSWSEVGNCYCHDFNLGTWCCGSAVRHTGPPACRCCVQATFSWARSFNKTDLSSQVDSVHTRCKQVFHEAKVVCETLATRPIECWLFLTNRTDTVEEPCHMCRSTVGPWSKQPSLYRPIGKLLAHVLNVRLPPSTFQVFFWYPIRL